MPLSIFRRHAGDCKETSTARNVRTDCRCTIHVEGTLNGTKYRESLHTANWGGALKTIAAWEVAGGKPVAVSSKHGKTVADALALWYTEASSAGKDLAPGTLKNYSTFVSTMTAYSIEKGLVQLGAWGYLECMQMVASWTDFKRRYVRNRTWKLKQFFEFCKRAGFIKENPAKEIKLAKRRVSEATEAVQPFSNAEMDKIFTEAYRTDKQVYGFVLAGRYLGLRIGDISRLNKADFKDGIFGPFLTQKGKVSVTMAVEPELWDYLASLPTDASGYYFHETPRGNAGDDLSAVWGARVKNVIKRAGLSGHAHQLRHTFAVSLLDQGFTLYEVSKLLGHKSVRITEESYAKFTKGQQDDLNTRMKAMMQANYRSKFKVIQGGIG